MQEEGTPHLMLKAEPMPERVEVSGVSLTQVCAAAKPGLPLYLHRGAVEGLSIHRIIIMSSPGKAHGVRQTGSRRMEQERGGKNGRSSQAS